VSLVGCGAFADWHAPSWWEDVGGEVVTAATPLQLALAQLEQTTLIARTLEGCSEVQTSSLGGLGIVHLADGGFWDAITFWNWRALMPVMFDRGLAIYVDTEVAKHPEFRAGLHDAMDRIGKTSTPDLTLVSLTIGAPGLAGIRRRLGLKAHKSKRISHHLAISDAKAEELGRSAILNVDPTSSYIGDRTPGVRSTTLATFTSPTTLIRVTSPISFKRPGGSHILVSFSGSDVFDVPRSPGTARLFERNAVWRHGRLEVETSARPHYQFSLQMPSIDEALGVYLQDKGSELRISGPGRLARGLIDRLSTGGLAAFEDPSTIAVVRSLTPARSKSLVKELEQSVVGSELTPGEIETTARRLGDTQRQGAIHLGQVAGGAHLSEKVAASALLRLAKAGLVFQGWMIKCPTCGLDTFLQLRETRPKARCPGCRSEASYVLDARGEPRLHYRLNSLLARASDQGVLVHLLAAAKLIDRDPTTHMVLGADILDSAGATLGEVDILAVSGTDVLSGEAKSSLEAFTPEQIKRDVDLSHRLGANFHVLACPVPVSDGVLSMCEDLCKAAGLKMLNLAPNAD
jgi:hypothetical protein